MTARAVAARLADRGWSVPTAEEVERVLPGAAGGRGAVLHDVVVRAVRPG